MHLQEILIPLCGAGLGISIFLESSSGDCNVQPGLRIILIVRIKVWWLVAASVNLHPKNSSREGHRFWFLKTVISFSPLKGYAHTKPLWSLTLLVPMGSVCPSAFLGVQPALQSFRLSGRFLTWCKAMAFAPGAGGINIQSCWIPTSHLTSPNAAVSSSRENPSF